MFLVEDSLVGTIKSRLVRPSSEVPVKTANCSLSSMFLWNSRLVAPGSSAALLIKKMAREASSNGTSSRSTSSLRSPLLDSHAFFSSGRKAAANVWVRLIEIMCCPFTPSGSEQYKFQAKWSQLPIATYQEKRVCKFLNGRAFRANA
jgi:hypothetical protein